MKTFFKGQLITKSLLCQREIMLVNFASQKAPVQAFGRQQMTAATHAGVKNNIASIGVVKFQFF